MHDIPGRIADVLLEVEANLRTSDCSTGSLLKLIKRFDDLIAIQSAARRH